MCMHVFMSSSRADERFNSGLFHFRSERGRVEAADRLTPNLIIDDKPLKEILERLYYPDSPYEFSVLPADILGQVYEQFLGKVISLSKGHRARVDEKPEVRRAGGVYYTPTYIVDHIVDRTLGELVRGRTPRSVSSLRILDPACGSGSFLIQAYQFLLDWHRDYYVASGAEKHARGRPPRLSVGPDGAWRLTTGERKRILLNNIFGVDIDSQAVEVTKLSLLLKVLEGESAESLALQLRLFQERALPDLGSNIRCGNSLVGTDIDDMTLVPDWDEDSVNPFDFEAEFPSIMPSGGFHVVIGNPPYDVLEKERGASSWPHKALSEYVRYNDEFEPALGGKLNLFRFFIVRSLNLTRVGGRYGMIVPLALLADISVASTRRHLMLMGKDLLAECFPQKDSAKRRVFRDAKLSTLVFTTERTSPRPSKDADIRVRVYPWNSFDDPYRESTVRMDDAKLLDPEHIPVPLTDTANWELCLRIHRAKNVVRLGDLGDFTLNRGEINQSIYRSFITDDDSHARLLKGVEVGSYRLNEELSQSAQEWFDETAFLRKHTRRDITLERRIATQRITGMDEKTRIVATIIEPPVYFADSTNSIALFSPNGGIPLEYLLGLLNSTLFQWRFKITSTNNNVGTNELEGLPFRLLDPDDDSDVRLQHRMITLVDRMMRLWKEYYSEVLDDRKAALMRRIKATDRAINELVYELYGLCEADIDLVEDLEPSVAIQV